MELKLKKIKQKFKLSDLSDLEFFNNIPKLLLTLPNPNLEEKQVENNILLDTDVESESSVDNNEKKEFYEQLYHNSWKDFQFKELFNNDYELYSFWLDIVSDDYFENFLVSLSDGILKKELVEKNQEYIDIYTQYLKNGNSVSKMINQYNEKPNNKSGISLYNLLNILDTTLINMDELTVANHEGIILIAKKPEKVIELKKKLMINGEFNSRELMYHSKNSGHIFISIIEFSN